MRTWSAWAGGSTCLPAARRARTCARRTTWSYSGSAKSASPCHCTLHRCDGACDDPARAVEAIAHVDLGAAGWKLTCGGLHSKPSCWRQASLWLDQAHLLQPPGFALDSSAKSSDAARIPAGVADSSRAGQEMGLILDRVDGRPGGAADGGLDGAPLRAAARRRGAARHGGPDAVAGHDGTGREGPDRKHTGQSCRILAFAQVETILATQVCTSSLQKAGKGFV